MMFTNHMIVGAAVYVVCQPSIWSNSPVVGLVSTLAFFFGVLLPDIDHPDSKLGRRVRFISVPIALVFGHRKITHSLWMSALWIAGVHYQQPALQAMFIGVLAHFLADTVTGRLPVLYPLKYNIGFDITFRSKLLEFLLAILILISAVGFYLYRQGILK